MPVTWRGRAAVVLAMPLWQTSRATVEETRGEDQRKRLRTPLSSLEEINLSLFTQYGHIPIFDKRGVLQARA
jgi:hypothetical protein